MISPKTFRIGLTLFLLACSLRLSAQLTLSAEVRPRAEFRHGFKKLIDPAVQDPAFFVEQRSRFNLHYKQEKLTLKIVLQDVRIWGAERQIYKTTDGFGNQFAAVHEGWAKYDFSSKLGLKVGRQELNYDNARFLGNLGWAQQARSHDLALFTYQDSATQFHLGAAFNQDANTPEFAKLLSTFYGQAGNYKTMQFAWYHRQMGKTGLSLFFLNNGAQAFDSIDGGFVRFSQTAGTYIKSKAGKVALEGEAYYQFGTDPAGNELNAFLLAANATLPVNKKLSLTIGGDYVSGTSLDADAGTNSAFSPLYGTNHKFYGLMDYYYVGNPSAQMGKTVGLIDPYIKAKIGLGKAGTLLTHVHHFLSPVEIYQNPEGRTGLLPSSMGTEVDLIYVKKMAKDVMLKAGYSQLFGTETMAAIKGGDASATQSWAWVMIAFTPTLLKK